MDKAPFQVCLTRRATATPPDRSTKPIRRTFSTMQALLSQIINGLAYGSIALFLGLWILQSFRKTQPVALVAPATPVEVEPVALAVEPRVLITPPPAAVEPVQPARSVWGWTAPADRETAAMVEAHQEIIALFWATPAPAPARAVAKAKPVGATSRPPSNAEALRKECQIKGIRWRNAQPNGKHLTVLQMKEALGLL